MVHSLASFTELVKRQAVPDESVALQKCVQIFLGEHGTQYSPADVTGLLKCIACLLGVTEPLPAQLVKDPSAKELELTDTAKAVFKEIF